MKELTECCITTDRVEVTDPRNPQTFLQYCPKCFRVWRWCTDCNEFCFSLGKLNEVRREFFTPIQPRRRLWV